ncbi:MAG: hypothetical protein ISS52_00195 [Dehalococcoidia bacterium]|nr:hypothetical protein [Dehalococcoidia bacterium]
MIDSQNTEAKRCSSYLQCLPALFRDDDFVGRFLCIFEDILKTLEGVVDTSAFYFDPGTTPQSFLPWLASWVGLVLDERWPETRQPELVRSVAELYRWQGTKRGLSRYLEIYTGVTPQIVEHTGTPSMQSEANTEGATSQPDDVEDQACCFSVTLDVPDTSKISADIVRRIIETEKPAHTTYVLKIGKQKPNI